MSDNNKKVDSEPAPVHSVIWWKRPKALAFAVITIILVIFAVVLPVVLTDDNEAI